MSETLTTPSPQESKSRKEKTPAEVNAQIGRITSKLMERAAKLESRPKIGTTDQYDLNTENGEIFGMSYDDKNYVTKGILTDKTQDGDRIRTSWNKQEEGQGFGSYRATEGPHVIRYASEKGGNIENLKHIELKFDENGSKGTYTTGHDSPNRRQLPTTEHADTAAKILMKMRGDIAQNELSSPEAAQADVNKLLK